MHKKLFTVFILILSLWSCNPDEIKQSYSNLPELAEQKILKIALNGQIAERSSEISGLCWYNDFLIILPQYPQRFNSGKIFYIKKDSLIKYIDRKINSISPQHFNINISDIIKYFHIGSGFEAVASCGDTLFFSIEDLNLGKTQSLLIRGIVDTLSQQITLDTSSIVVNQPQVNLHNISDESLLIADNMIIPIYEANGKLINQNPQVRLYSKELEVIRNLLFPNIEYRITDVTEIDSNNCFWAINYLFPGDIEKLKISDDLLIHKYGIGKTHKEFQQIERIIKLKYSENEIQIADQAPVYLKLDENDSRNWEGIVKLNDLGFVLATDTYPETILAFVEFPPK